MYRNIPVLILSSAVALGALAPGYAAEMNISHGSIELRPHAVLLHAHGKPDARILSDGDLLIDGKAVALTAAGRALTQRYYADAHGVAAAGEAVGKAGGWLALKIVGSLFSALWHGDSAIVDRTAHSQQARLQGRVDDLCGQLSALKTVQDRLAAAQPVFTPYAYIRTADVTKCYRDAKNGSH